MCENCNSEQTDIFKGLDLKWYMRVESDFWDDYNDELVFTDVEIIYCPHCGRKLE